MTSVNQATYLFYDIETSGLNKCFDQIVQFAAIRTDLDLNEIERHEFFVRLNPDVIPSPQAFITHRISIKQCQQGLTEIEAVQKIHKIFNTPKTISIGYNNLGFDDEFLRFSFFRNLLPPYTHQYANNCSRMDLYPITVMYYLFKPEILAWPKDAEKISLKLENLNHANNLASGIAHNAMVDVKATLALARKLRVEQDMWQYVCGHFNKEQDLSRISQLSDKEALLVRGKIGSESNFIAPVLNLGNHQHYKNQTLWLRMDSPNLQKTTMDSIAEHTFVFRKKPAEDLLVLPSHERFLKHFNNERLALAKENKAWLQNNAAIFSAIRKYHQDFQYPKIPGLDLDASLYEIGFPTWEEESLFQQFHQADPAKKIGIAEKFPKTERRMQAMRILGRHYPEILNPQQLKLFQEYLFKNNHAQETDLDLAADYRGEKKLTLDKALAQIQELKLNSQLDHEQINVLEEIKNYLSRQADLQHT